MKMKCPGCKYIRKRIETVPEWQCPKCGIAYNKHPDYIPKSHFKVILMYKKYPKDDQVKVNRIYVYLRRIQFDIEHIQIAFVNKNGSVSRIELSNELIENKAEIFQILSTNRKLKKNHKNAIINIILKETESNELTENVERKKVIRYRAKRINQKDFYIRTVLPIVGIIIILLLIYTAYRYYMCLDWDFCYFNPY
ncbi:hypothetical protein [Legionella cherrii]|nr:hypothetical protein [Legionella cherrii]